MGSQTPKKKLLKKTMTETRKNDFVSLKTFFLTFSNFCSYIFCKYNFLSTNFNVKITLDKEMVEIYVFSVKPMFYQGK